MMPVWCDLLDQLVLVGSDMRRWGRRTAIHNGATQRSARRHRCPSFSTGSAQGDLWDACPSALLMRPDTILLLCFRCADCSLVKLTIQHHGHLLQQAPGVTAISGRAYMCRVIGSLCLSLRIDSKCRQMVCCGLKCPSLHAPGRFAAVRVVHPAALVSWSAFQ